MKQKLTWKDGGTAVFLRHLTCQIYCTYCMLHVCSTSVILYMCLHLILVPTDCTKFDDTIEQRATRLSDFVFVQLQCVLIKLCKSTFKLSEQVKKED